MSDYLEEKFDFSDTEIVSVYDELPLWSSYFGVKLLDHVEYRNNLNVLDIGSGAGFPMLELAQRLGSGSKVTGIDPWSAACERIKLKIKVIKLNNVTILNQPAEDLPFTDSSFDLVTSNNGINNVQDPDKVLSECFRVMKKKAKLLMTVNLPGTMKEFYDIFKNVLNSDIMTERIEIHIKSKRKTVDENIELLERNNFIIRATQTDSFYIRCADGTAFLNHYFIKLAFLDSWKKIPEGKNIKEVFSKTENELNKIAAAEGGLKITVPFALFECYKKE